MGFLKRNEIKEKEVPIMPEPKVEVKEILRKKVYLKEGIYPYLKEILLNI